MNNFTHADIKSISENGTVSCDMLIIEVDEEGNETEVYREGFTSYDEGNYPFELFGTVTTASAALISTIKSNNAGLATTFENKWHNTIKINMGAISELFIYKQQEKK